MQDVAQTWTKGGPSPNPGGKPQGLEQALHSLRREILAQTGGARWFANKLMEFVQHAPDHKDKLTALKLLMEYGYGKPVQNVQLDGLGEGGVQIIVNTGVLQPEKPGAIPATPVTIVEEKKMPPIPMNEGIDWAKIGMEKPT